MAVVRITSYTRNRGAAKASIRYITHRPGKDGRVTTRSLYTTDGEVTKNDAYQMIDEAQKGSVFFRIVISPDGKQEDTRKDLYLWQITEQTMLTLEERFNTHVPFTATEHNDHTGNRHVHLLACLKGRIEKGVGRWRMSAPAPDGYPATSVVDLAPNGTFYLTMNQVWYTINITGNYTLSSGTMRFKTANWSPREYGGHPIRPVPAWAMHYRIIDRNRLDTTDSYGNSVISERILSRPKAVGEAPFIVLTREYWMSCG